MRPGALLSCLFCLVLQKAAGQAPDTFYLIMVPAEIHHPIEDHVCIILYGITEPVQFTITLQSGSRNTKLMDVHTEGPGFQECQPFKVPAPAGGVEEVATIQFWLTGNRTNLQETKNILIRRIHKKGIIQTDKPVYLPGQTVQIRGISMDSNFIPGKETWPLMKILDPHGYGIAEWKDQSPQQGVVGMNFTLPSELVMGTYTVIAAHLSAMQTFLVSKNELPKYEVLINLPPVVTLEDESFTVMVCARYSYARPVSGNVQATLCHPAVEFHWYGESQEDNCKTFQGKTDKNGCWDSVVETKDFDLPSYEFQSNFKASAFLMEADTGVTLSSTAKCAISPFITTVTFEDSGTDNIYKPGIKFRGAIRLLRADGTAMKAENVYLTVQHGWHRKEMVYTTNAAGRAFFVLETSAWNGYPVTLKAQYKKEQAEFIYGQRNPVHVDASKTLYMFHSMANSFVKIQPPEEVLACDQEYPMEVDYSVRRSDIPADEITIYYVVFAKRNILRHGHIGMNISEDTVTKGTLHIPIPVSSDIAPQAKLLIYAILPKGKLMADIAEFSVSKCFKNKAQMAFSDNEALPGSNVSLRIQAQPGSLCNVRVVDESVTLVRPEAEITPDSVYQLMVPKNPVGYPWLVQELDPPCRPRPRWSRSVPDQREAHKIQKRSNEAVVETMNQIDFFTIIRRAGIKVLTNCPIKKPPQCSEQQNRPPVGDFVLVNGPDGEERMLLVPADSAEIDVEELIDFEFDSIESRLEKEGATGKYFPQTLLFNQIHLDSSGTAEMSITLPDTTTEWKATMFCTSETGFWIASTQSLTAFQPFFAELTLPDSVFRGETFILIATFFNYSNVSIQVTLTLPETEAKQNDPHRPRRFDVRPRPDCIYTRCLEAGTSATFSWHVVTISSGEVQISAEVLITKELCGGEKTVVPENGATDTVTRSFKVKAEGLSVETSHNTLLYANGNHSYENISIKCPADAVNGSQRGMISFTGDMMGKSLKNMEDLMVMPAGSGGQTLDKLLTLINLHEYLEKTEQKTESSKKIIGLITTGIPQLLMYKRFDGSFSDFGERDDEGNTWLSASTVNFLYKASAFVPVDSKIIRECLSWLADTQLPNGCFQPSGRPFKRSLMDELNDLVRVTAYISIRLLEVEEITDHLVVENALTCLRNVTNEAVGTHTQAMLAYVYSLSGDDDLRAQMLKKLYENVDILDGSIFWTLTRQTENKPRIRRSRSKEGEIETSALILQAHLRKKNVAKDDIKMASEIADRLILQQNSKGSYPTSQETAEALKALGKYAAMTYSDHQGSNVTLTSPEGFRQVFNVNEDSQLLLQEIQLPCVPDEYRVDVEGDGRVYVETNVRYQDLHPVENAGFSLRVDAVPKDCNNYSCRNFALHIQTSYEGSGNESNLALVEVGLPSGFHADAGSLTEVEKLSLMRRIDIMSEKLLIYLDHVNNTSQDINFTINEYIEVLDRKNSTVTISDLYTADYSASASYAVRKP